MKLSKKSVIKIAITSVFFICMVFANFYALKKMSRMAVELYLYDKLSVAYNFGGKKAVIEELKTVLSEDKYPRELALARELAAKIYDLKDMELFLKGKILQIKKKIELIRSLRTIAIIVMFVIFLWQLCIRLLERFNLRFGLPGIKKKA